MLTAFLKKSKEYYFCIPLFQDMTISSSSLNSRVYWDTPDIKQQSLFVYLFGCRIINHEPLDRFSSNLISELGCRTCTEIGVYSSWLKRVSN